MTAPRKVRGKPAFEVLFQIIGGGTKAVHKVLGVDEFQVLDLALKSIGRELEAERYSNLRWRFGMNSRDLGFPRGDDQKLPSALVEEIGAAVEEYRQRAKSPRPRSK